MKWLFFIVLAANIAIYVWGLQRETDISTTLDPRFRNVGEMILLTKEDLAIPEIVQSPVSESAEEPEATSEQQFSSEESVSVTTTETVSATDESTPEAELSAGGEGEIGEVVENAILGEVNNDSPESATPPLGASAEATDKLPLAQAEEVETAEVETVVPQDMFCWTLGPITQKPSALNLLEVVEEKALSAGLREEIEKNITGFWVLLPPYENARAANEVVKQLKSRDVVDVQRFYKGEFQNGVSLGIYNRRFNAEKRRAQIETKGFSAEVVPRYNEVPRYWIDYRTERDVNGDVDIPPALRGLTASRRKCSDPSN